MGKTHKSIPGLFGGRKICARYLGKKFHGHNDPGQVHSLVVVPGARRLTVAKLVYMTDI